MYCTCTTMSRPPQTGARSATGACSETGACSATDAYRETGACSATGVCSETGALCVQVFQKVSQENKGKVHVFYCGSTALAKVIKAECEHFNFNFYKENF